MTLPEELATASPLHAATYLVLQPPVNVERALFAVQQEIFAEDGLASAMAVPPIAPLAVMDEGTPDHRFAERVAEMRQGFRIDLRRVERVGSCLFAAIETDASAADRLRRVRSLGEPAGNGPLPIHTGFFLCDCGDLAATPSPQLSCPGFGSFHYALLRLAYTLPPEPWWQRVEWRITARVRTRRGQPFPRKR